MIDDNCMFARARLEQLNDVEDVQNQKEFIEYLETVISLAAVKRMLVYLITQQHCIRLKDLLVEHLQIPDNLTDKELIVYLQLLE